MQTTSISTNPSKGNLRQTQTILYGLLAALFLFGLFPLAREIWRQYWPRHTTATASQTVVQPHSSVPKADQEAQVQPTAKPQADTAAPVVAAATPPPDPAAVSMERLGDEVSRTVINLPRWTPAALDPAQMKEYGSGQMAELEGWKSRTFARNAADYWRGMADVPTLAGRYARGQIEPSDWPRPGSFAVVLTPLDTDPSGRAGPWRVVLFIATSSEASANAAMYSATYANERLTLGKGTIPAVPVAREAIGTNGTTYYCVIPAAQAAGSIAGTKIVQTMAPAAAAPIRAATPAPMPDAYAAWKAKHDVFLADVKKRAAAATTQEQRTALQEEIAEWKRQNPEPSHPTTPGPIPAGNGFQ